MPNIIRSIATDDEFGTQTIRMIVSANERGATGPQGEPGEAATITAGQAYSVNPGDNPQVINTGTSSAAVFDFYIPKGEKGEPGPAGKDAAWGDITGTLSDQGDLQNALDAKQNELIPGNNVQINGDTISATDTTYTAGDNITITGNVISADIAPTDFFTAGATVSGTGNPVVLNNTIGLPLDSLQLDGDITQQTYTGKNKFNVDGDFSYGGYSDVITKNSDGTITTSSDFSSARGNGQNLSSVLQPNTTYTLSATLTAHTSSSANVAIIQICSGLRGSVTSLGLVYYQNNETKTIVFTTPADVSSVWVSFNSNGASTTATFGSIQLEQGSAATAYEPYVGGIASPNPDYPQEVQVVTGEQTVTITDGGSQSQSYEVNLGKNLVDASAATASYRLASDGTLVNDNGFSVTDYIMVEPNTQYTVSMATANSTYYVNLCQYNSGKTMVGTRDYWENTARTFTTGANTAYIRVSCGKTNFGSSLQIEKGSTATSYAAYSTPIELCKIGTYQDYIYKSGDDWYVHKAIDKEILDQTRGWSKRQFGTNAYWFNYTPVATNSGAIGIMSPQFTGVSYDNRTATINNIIFLDAAPNMPPRDLGITVRNTSFSNLNDFLSWITNNNITVYYALATPTDTQITDSTLIDQLEALASASTYLDNTILTVTSENLPAGLEVTALRNSLAGIIGALGRQ